MPKPSRFEISSANVALLVVALTWPAAIGPAQMNQVAAGASVAHKLNTALLVGRPLVFEPAVGQAYCPPKERVRFLARSGGYTLFLGRDQAVFALDGGERGGERHVLRMKFVGGNSHVTVSGSEPLQSKSNYFLGSNPSQQHTDVPNYTRVTYHNIYPGIDLVFYGKQSELEYDWIIRPGGRPESVRLAFTGAEGLRVDAAGGLLIETAGGRVVQPRASIYQQSSGRPVSGGYAQVGPHEVRLRVADYDRKQTLVVDPVLVYSALLGGTGGVPRGDNTFFTDAAQAIAVDGTGNAYVAGLAYANDFPTVNPIGPSPSGTLGPYAVLLKINAAGTSLVYSTYIAVSSLYSGSFAGATTSPQMGVAVDQAGDAYLTGGVISAGLAVVNALQPNFGGGMSDIFVAKVNPTGSALLFSTYLGGSGEEFAGGIAVDAAGNAYITGFTSSKDFPTTKGAFQTTLRASSPCGYDACGNAFVTKLNTNGALIYSTYLGGSGYAAGSGIAADSQGNAYVTGFAVSPAGFPTTPGAFQPAAPGATCRYLPCTDAFVSKLSPDGSALVYSTYLGGGGSDSGNGIAIDSSGNAYVVGTTFSADFPTTTGAFQGTFTGSVDSYSNAFITKLNASGSALAYSTYLGAGSPNTGLGDFGLRVAVDSQGNAVAVGFSGVYSFPTVNPLQAASSLTVGGCITSFCVSGFLAKFNAAGSQLLFSTPIGGGDGTLVNAIAIGPTGDFYIAGDWRSGVLPTAGPLQIVKNVAGAFVERISEAGSIPLLAPASITNAASFAMGITPGGLVSLFGSDITNVTGIVTASGLPLPTQIAGTSVTIYSSQAVSESAPILAVANVNGQQQVNFQWPFDMQGYDGVVVGNNGSLSVPVPARDFRAQPAIFMIDATTPAIQHASNFQPVTVSNPASAGELIAIYLTGLGDVSPRPAAGQAASVSPLSVAVIVPTATVGGLPASVLFSGLAPGFVGLYQVNLQVPANAPTGNLDLVIVEAVGNFVQSSPAVKLAVR
jgi:uncharacterized protein (TIGR03437 family)